MAHAKVVPGPLPKWEPLSLGTLASTCLMKMLVYEDPKEACYYRCDPVDLWRYEFPRAKKKKKKCDEVFNPYHIDLPVLEPLLPSWTYFKKIQKWLSSEDGNWCLKCFRPELANGLERLSWNSGTEEEDLFFFLMSLFFSTDYSYPDRLKRIFLKSWTGDIGRIIRDLGRFPLTSLDFSRTKESYQWKPIVSGIISCCSELRILRVNSWDLEDSILQNLGICCSCLEDLSIFYIDPEFELNSNYYRCFFLGISKKEVDQHYYLESKPPLSFPKLRHLDIAISHGTRHLLLMLLHFYEKVTLGSYSLIPLVNTNPPSVEDPLISRSTRLQINLDNIDDSSQVYFPHTKNIKELRIEVLPPKEEFEVKDLACKLKHKLTQLPAVTSVSILVCFEMSLTELLQPFLEYLGKKLDSLDIVYENSIVSLSELFGVINMCPDLLRLSISLREAIAASDNEEIFEMNQNDTLHTLIIDDVLEDSLTDISVESHHLLETFYFEVTSTIIQASPNLQQVSLYLMPTTCNTIAMENCIQKINLTTGSVSSETVEDVKALLNKLPRAKVVSIDCCSREFWQLFYQNQNQLPKGNITCRLADFPKVHRYLKISICDSWNFAF